MSNDEIFAAAYREHYWAVSRYVARRLPERPDEVEEVVAEVFTVAWRRRHDLPDAPLPWLYGVARNCLSNAVRSYGRRRRLVGRLGNDEAAHSRHIVASPDSETPGAWVREVLDRLSAPDQEILRLAAWEELDARQIAVVLGCGSRAAAMRLHRARRRLRAEIDRMRLTPSTAGAPPGQDAGATTPKGMSATRNGTALETSHRMPGTAASPTPELSEDADTAGGAGTDDGKPAGEKRHGAGSSRSVSTTSDAVPLCKDPRHA